MPIVKLNIVKLFSVIACFTLLYGCSSSNKVASSFSQRKYTKGYFWNIPAERPSVASKKEHFGIDKKIWTKQNEVVNFDKIKSSIEKKTLAPVFHLGEFATSKKELKSRKPIYIVDEIVSTHTSVTPSDSAEDKGEKDIKLGTQLFITAGVVLLLGITFTLLAGAGFPLWIFILLGIVFLIFGYIFRQKGIYEKNPSVKPNDSAPEYKWGSHAFKCTVAIISLILLTFIFYLIDISLIVNGYLFLFLVVICSYAAIILAICSVIFAIKALIIKEPHRGLTIAALVICAICALVLLFSVVNGSI
ncbi:MAG: hypothetical protein ACLQQ4_05985 [Bacteroidia bacterium]